MVRVEDSYPRERGFASREQQDLLLAFERGVMAGGPVQEEKAGPGGPVQNIFDVGGGGGGRVGGGILASLPGQEGTHRSL